MITFTKDDIIEAVKANGWTQLWHEDNWVHKSSENPDWAGMSLINAFAILMHDANIASVKTILEKSSGHKLKP